MKNKSFTYRTNLEKQTEELIVAAQTEQYYEELKAPLNQLKSKVQPSLSADLIRYKEEIKQLLAQQIGFHYYLLAGERESTIATDVELKEAIRLLSDSPAYQKLLTPAR
jgi:carboxyl-terminal processing protease